MNRRKSLQLLLAGGTLTHLTACDSLPAAAIAPWQALPEPPPELAHDPRWPALAWAMLAPSPHNLQPWLADVRQPGCVRLWPDPQRQLHALAQAMYAELGVAAPRRVHMLLRVGHSPSVTPPSPRREVRHILLPQAIRS